MEVIQVLQLIIISSSSSSRRIIITTTGKLTVNRWTFTSFRAHLIQEFDHALSLHGGPGSDGRSSSDFTVLLLDLGRAAFGYEWPEFTIERKTTL